MPVSTANAYNAPTKTDGGTASGVGLQAISDYYFKKALIAVRDHQYFMPLADVRAMPKHMGKKIKQDVYVPMIDALNTGDQGIDAAEAVLVAGTWSSWNSSGVLQEANDATEADAITEAGANGDVALNDQNLYGSSKDTGAILNKIPLLREHGGRVNRVGFTRTQVEGELLKRGFFTEYTQESMDFDSDSELLSHIVEEALVGANEITEAELQKDLITTATSDGTAYFCSGTASAAVPALAGSTVAAGATRTALKLAVDEVVVYEDLMNLSIALDDNKTPKQTKVISGSRMIDTKTVNGGRIMYIGSELIPVVRKMTDITGSGVGSGFISVEKYADASNTVHGEIGSVDQFRIVVVPEMQHDRKGGASAANTAGTGKQGADIYPMLVVGDGAFTTIGFQTDGKSVKFSVNHKKPGKEIASLDDPYGEVGFYSIKWYYGFMALRPERLGIIWTALEAV
jgi:N4-gp56 family major capsid protein